MATHHPPFLIGIAAADQCAVPADDRGRFAEVCRRQWRVVRVIYGHVHRPFAGAVAATPAVVGPRIYAQGAPRLYADGELRSHFQSVARAGQPDGPASWSVG